mmetsp:Transcript_48129/g.102397  ORF Transcript_48129/g.102397 Transcript_48129/m.102397 type:complete len:100 (+) Transcript_48129:324-623(+)
MFLRLLKSESASPPLLASDNIRAATCPASEDTRRGTRMAYEDGIGGWRTSIAYEREGAPSCLNLAKRMEHPGLACNRMGSPMGLCAGREKGWHGWRPSY